ncbi:MAG: DUF362 domain-containing protein [Desulfobacteraceae bacterium]|nr:DUF362 domain-containing protein [Desulfobacteraceae bacterium]MBC2749207.1 DUF362 domain-containing protein [Desulfobacteraceae bacterium]
MDQFDALIPPLKDAQVLMKINLCLLLGPETGATLDPRVVHALVKWLLENRPVKEIVLAESDATQMSADIAYRALGWADLFDRMPKVRFLNLSHDNRISINSVRTYIKDLEMSETYMNCDWLVDVAKLKTHTEQLITCCLKNIFGAIPKKVKYVYHPRLTEAICDANSARLPDFGFIDGLVATENDGPTKGTPRQTGLLLAGNDTVALDHYASIIMGFNPKRVPHLQMALERKMGSSKYRIIDPNIKPCRPAFAFMPLWKQFIRRGVKKMRTN